MQTKEFQPRSSATLLFVDAARYTPRDATTQGHRTTPPAPRHRWRFVRASGVSRVAEDDPPARRQGCGAIVGFANFLLRFYADVQPRAVLVGWDTLDAPTYRNELFDDYQGGRAFDAELVDQLDVLPVFVAACGFANAKGAGYEADDFLAAAVAKEERSGTAIVATGDRDAWQLASAKTTILRPLRAGEMARIGPKEVRAEYGVDPAQVPDFIALRGDPSDKLPGARGVGPKGAAQLLRKYGTLEKALAAVSSPPRRRSCVSIAASRPWTRRRRCPL